MPYCQHCGGEVEHSPEVAATAETVSAEVQIARINADRDIAVEKIRARQMREELETIETVAEVEAEAEVASAEATAEIIGEVLAANDAPAEEPEPEPVIVPELPEAEPDLAPPVAESHESGPPKKSGWGFS